MNTHRPKELDDHDRFPRPMSVVRTLNHRPIPRTESPLVPAIVGGLMLLGMGIWAVGLMTTLRWVLERVA